MLVYLVSLGCDKNLVDSEIMLGLLGEAGYTATSDETEADVIIINTCGFIMEATEESIQTVLRLAAHKQSGRCKALIVTGCMAKRYKDDIFKEMPEVDAVVGPGDYEAVCGVVERVLGGGGKIRLVSEGDKAEVLTGLKRVVTTPAHLAYLKIAEGCDNHCTYCTIPSIRGAYRSRTPESLLEEAELLARRGVKELILVAQDTARYGVDICGNSLLHELLRRLSELDGVEWIRVLYCYPEHLTDETIREMARNRKVCHYLDMPLQHCSDKVLKLMGRRGSRRDLENIIAKLREAMPDISLRTTLMTGFPGEGEDEYRELLRFVEETRFDNLGAFAFSPEDGTPARALPEQNGNKTKTRRKNSLLRLQKRISGEIRAHNIGKQIKVIIDGYLPEQGVYCGRGQADCYEVDGMVFVKSGYELNAGDFVDVSITAAADYDMYGEAVY